MTCFTVIVIITNAKKIRFGLKWLTVWKADEYYMRGNTKVGITLLLIGELTHGKTSE